MNNIDGLLLPVVEVVARNDNTDVLHALESWRKQREITQREVAASLGISRSHYGMICNGKTPLSQPVAQRIAVYATYCDKAPHRSVVDISRQQRDAKNRATLARLCESERSVLARLEKRRVKRQWSHTELARRVGIGYDTYQSSRHTGVMAVETRQKIINFLTPKKRR